MKISNLGRLALVAGALGAPCFGQLVADLALPDAPASGKSSASVVAATQPKMASSEPAWEQKLDRWVDVNDLTFALRYRSIFDDNNAHEFNQGQQRTIADGRFKFDPQGKYSVVVHASSGHYFNWAYADFEGGGNEQAINRDAAKATRKEGGTLQFILHVPGNQAKVFEQSGGWAFYVRRLYADLEPVKGIEVQYGSMDFNRGASSEITTYDNDGYIAGERLSLKRPKNLFFSEASVTYAYLGDIYQPNFFERGHRLAHANYHQFLLRKEIKKRVDTSFDYTWQAKSNTLREAAKFHIPEARIVDDVRFEAYQRLNFIRYPGVPVGAAGGNGFAITLDKKVNSRLQLEAGMANIDIRSVVLTQQPIAAVLALGVNGDQYGVGNRYFVRPTVKLTRYLEANGYYTHDYNLKTDGILILWNKQALNAGLVFDMKKAFFSEKNVK